MALSCKISAAIHQSFIAFKSLGHQRFVVQTSRPSQRQAIPVAYAAGGAQQGPPQLHGPHQTSIGACITLLTLYLRRGTKRSWRRPRYLHYFIKHGAVSKKPTKLITLAVVLVLSWLTSCERTDDGFVGDLWRIVRLTPGTIRYTAWLAAPTESWPSKLRGGSLIDIGASTGLDTLFYSYYSNSFGRQHVVAVEVDRKVHRLLRSALQHLNVSVFHRALLPDKHASQPSSPLYISTLDISKHGLENISSKTALELKRGERRHGVKITSCRAIIQSAPKPAWYVKIDIEESGWSCVKSICGGPDWSQTQKPFYISVEDPSMWHPDADVVGFLQSCGYVQFKLVRQEPFSHLIPMPDQALCKSMRCVNIQGATYLTDMGSGPFGEDATDWRTGQVWRQPVEVRRDLQVLNSMNGPTMRLVKNLEGGLFDIHAKLIAS